MIFQASGARTAAQISRAVLGFPASGLRLNRCFLIFRRRLNAAEMVYVRSSYRLQRASLARKRYSHKLQRVSKLYRS